MGRKINQARVTTWLLAIVVCAAGCGVQAPPENEGPHPRVVSFSPSLTAMIFELGLGDHVVGVSGFCRLPPGVQRPVVGDLMNQRAEPILQTRPDIILDQFESTVLDVVRDISPNIRVEHFEIETMEDIAKAVERVGKILGDAEAGQEVAERFRETLETLRAKSESLPPKRVLFISDFEQPLGAGGGTFMNEMITLAGGENVLADRFDGWRGTSLETVLQTQPEVIICQCSEQRKEQTSQYWAELGAKEFPHRVIVITDPNWTIPGTHLAELAAELSEKIHAL